MGITLRDIGKVLVRWAPWADGLAHALYNRLPSQLHDTPTTFLDKLFQGDAEVYFLEIGANDGVAGDPLRPLILSDKRWRGVLVEPQPGMFGQLKANYAAQADRLTFLQCAISSQAGALPFHYLPQSEIDRLNLPEWASEVASFDASHVEKHFPEAAISTVDIPVFTVAQITSQHGYDRIDVLVIDVEGHERPIIESIDWAALKIRACMFEHKHMPAEELAAIESRLSANGFTFKRYGRDTVAFKR